MRFINQQYDIEAWVEYLDDPDGRLPEHRSEQKLASHKRNGYEYSKGYLEMKEGKKFRLAVKVHSPVPRPYDLDIQLLIDGRDFNGVVLRRDMVKVDHQGPDRYLSRAYFMEGDRQMIGDLAFARMASTSEEREADVHGDDINNLCSIVLLIRQGSVRVNGEDEDATFNVARTVGKVYEKKMNVSGAVPNDTTGPMRTFSFLETAVDPEVCSMVWKYYTRDVLTIKGIVVMSHCADA